jgi:alditol oxidase
MSNTPGVNWAGNLKYSATELAHPSSVAELQELVAGSQRVRAIGSRHSFNDLADTTGVLVALDGVETDIRIDEASRTVSCSGGVRYGELAVAVQQARWALHNLASLPHISVAAVAALDIVDGHGELVHLERGDIDFAGAVVAVGALGIVTRVWLDIEPTFDVRQDVYEGLTFDAVFANFDAITSAAYSVSLFTDWQGDSLSSTWLKSRMDATSPPENLFGAPRLVVDRHMMADTEPSNTTQQGGVAGPWNDRLAHFRLEFTPSNGEELQTEYLVPRRSAIAALEAVRSLGDRIAPLLHITEVRTMAADDLWLSGAFETDAIGIHFTWKKLEPEVRALLPDIERLLLPLGARPHWGKLFDAGVAELEPLYPRLADFRSLADRFDPRGVFRNAFLERTIGLPVPLVE